MGEFFDQTIPKLESAISNSAKIQEVIAQNIANAQTPGYVPKVFDKELERAVDKIDKKSVNIEEEMADMAKNNMEHSSYIKLLTQKLGVLRTIVTQGRR